MNHGNMYAPQGHVVMGCGQEILLKPESEDRIFIRAHETKEMKEVGIHNLGKISAIQVDLQADGNPYIYAIKHDGFPFTIFYKDSPLILIASAEQGLVATAELFRDLHPYDEYIRWYLCSSITNMKLSSDLLQMRC